MRRAIVVLSGGQDSTTCLFYAKQFYDEVHAVTFNYNQRHAIEIEAAKNIAWLAGVKTHEIIDIPNILVSRSPLTDPNATLEQYKDWHSLPGGLEKTFVPMRNMTFLTIAANRAIAIDANALVTGVCQEDFGGYPDCRRVFINSVELAIRNGTALADGDPFSDFHIDTPLMDMSKEESVRWATTFKGCYGALGFSHTAYDGSYPPNGKDHATLLRAKGFEQAGVPDPLIVRAFWEGNLERLPQTSNYESFWGKISSMSPFPMNQRTTLYGYSSSIMIDALERLIRG